jgi:hypothetical protein
MSLRVAPGRRLGPLELREEIGRGGSAVVFRAWHSGLLRDVAVKVISGAYTADATFLARFRQEASFVSRLDHPHVLPLLESGETGPDDEVAEVAFLVTEFMPGGSLSETLQEERSTRERCVFAVAVAEQIGAALDHAHARDVLHRDLKPSNVLVAADGRFVLSDFGLARVLQSGASLHLTATGLVAGTPVYMAPEQALGEPAEWRTDLYGLAVMLYEIVVGRVPFDAETPLATMLAHVHQPPPSPRSLAAEVPRAVEVVLLHALAKSPDDRYGTGYEMARALRSAVTAAYGEGALHKPLASTFPEARALDARRPPKRKERVPALAARRPKRRVRLRVLALGASAFAVAASFAVGGAAIAFGPGRPTLATFAERYASNSLGPSWTEALPRDGARNEPLQARIVVRFNNEMDRETVQTAFRISPEVPVTFEWDGRMLTVTPQEDLRESTTYVVNLEEGVALDVQGRPLATSLHRRFTTRAAPVQAAQPAAGSLGGLPIFPLFQSQPTPIPATAAPERLPEVIRPSATAVRPTATARPATGQPTRAPESTIGAPAPTYAPPTAPAQPPDTSIVAGLVVTSEDADAELAAAAAPVTPVVPTPAPSTTPHPGVSLVNAPPALPTATPTARAVITVTPATNGTPAGTASGTAAAGVATTPTFIPSSGSATPQRASAATPTALGGTAQAGVSSSPSTGATIPASSGTAPAATATAVSPAPGQLATVTAMPYPYSSAPTPVPPAAAGTPAGSATAGAATSASGASGTPVAAGTPAPTPARSASAE